MIRRRVFLKSSLCGGVSLLCLPSFSTTSGAADDHEPPYRLSRDTPTRLYDGKRCWCDPRAGIVPSEDHNDPPRVVMTINTLDVAGSDVFKGVFGMSTDDLGRNWTEPRELAALAPRYETIDGQERPVAVSDFWPRWHAASKTLQGTGHTVVMAQVDPERLRVIRKSEQVLVPERGARLGNFGVADVSENETWVTVSEWMQKWGPNYVLPVDNEYGSDGSVWVARIHWNKPNRIG